MNGNTTIISSRRALFLGFAALAVLVAGFGAWSVSTKIAGAIVASGQIEVDSNRQVVQHIDGGVVSEILVREGDRVEAGAPLLLLDGTLLQSELTIVEGQFFEIQARRGRLSAERDDAQAVEFSDELVAAAGERADVAELMEGQRSLFAARRETMAQQIDQLAKRRSQTLNQIDGIDAQTEALVIQVNLIAEELRDQQDLLNKGLAQASRVLALQREEARLRGTLGELTAARAESQGRVTEIDIEVLRLEAARREDALAELRDLGYRELELAERRRALTEQIARLEIRAPVSGIVHAMQVTTIRSVIKPADAVMYIVPQDRPLVIAAQVPTIHIDEVHAGQEVAVKFVAFQDRTLPEIFGRVTLVSADAFHDQATLQSYYRAEIVLEPGEIDKLSGRPLVPGMPVESFIITGERTPLAYLLKPFTDYFQRAFRES